MNPLHRILPAARSRIERVSRRDVLAGGVAAGTYVAMRGVEELAVRALVDPLLSDSGPIPHMREELGMREFRRLAAPNQRAALEGIQLTGSVPPSAAGRCTKIAERDGEMWVIEQGEETGDILWNGPLLGPLSRRPDRTFGRWRAECVRVASYRSEPSFGFNRAIINGRPFRYFDLIVPGRLTTVITAEESASPAHNPRSIAVTTAQASV